jgi:hypothetical protein
MLYAAVALCPVPGGKVKSYDDAAVLKRRGIHSVVPVPGGLAVVADRFWRAKEAAAALTVQWDPGAGAGTSSAQFRRDYRAALDGPLQIARKDGETRLAALAKGEDAGLSWAAAKTVSRQEPQGLPQAALRKVMSADAAKLPAYAGVERGEEGYALYRITRVIVGAPREGSKAAEDFMRLDRQAEAAQLDAYVASLRAKAKIEVKPANLESK